MGKLFDVSLVFSSIPELLEKLPITLELALLAMVLALVIGLIMAIIKMKSNYSEPPLFKDEIRVA